MDPSFDCDHDSSVQDPVTSEVEQMQASNHLANSNAHLEAMHTQEEQNQRQEELEVRREQVRGLQQQILQELRQGMEEQLPGQREQPEQLPKNASSSQSPFTPCSPNVVPTLGVSLPNPNNQATSTIDPTIAQLRDVSRQLRDILPMLQPMAGPPSQQDPGMSHINGGSMASHSRLTPIADQAMVSSQFQFGQRFNGGGPSQPAIPFPSGSAGSDQTTTHPPFPRRVGLDDYAPEYGISAHLHSVCAKLQQHQNQASDGPCGSSSQGQAALAGSSSEPLINLSGAWKQDPPALVQPTVRLKTKTWTRESHGLFDYESKYIEEREFEMHKSFNVFRCEKEVFVDPEQNPQLVTEDIETLARVVRSDDKFWIDKPPQTDQYRSKYTKLWRVVKDVQGGLKLKEGDSIKLGRFKLKVRQLVADGGCAQGASMAMSSTFAPKLCIVDEKPDDTVCCRICLMEAADDPDDPMIRPCDCKGSIEHIHLQCLRHWINGRLSIERDHNGECPKGSYFFRPLNCELCKTLYATHLKRIENGAEVEESIVDLPKTKAPYVMLERESHRPEEKGVHVISLADKNRLKLGRGHVSDIRFNDVSISRWHATINYNPESESFTLEDHDSKFGTLLATKPPIALDEPLHFQAGRTVMNFFPPSATQNPFCAIGSQTDAEN